MNKKIAFVLSLVLLALASACSGLPATAGTVEMIDGLSRAVKVPARAQRIVSLAPSNTEILYAVGCGEQMVGRDEFSDYPEAAKNLPSVGGNMGTYDLEAITALKPDLVLAAEINTQEQVNSLDKLGITVYYLANPKDMNGLYANIQTIGRMCDKTQQASGLISSLKVRVKAVTDALLPISYVPTVFYELDGSDPNKPWTSGPGTFVSYLIGVAGGSNVGDVLSSSYAQISLEELLVQNPAVIILGDANYGTTPEQVAARAGWSGISAVQNKAVFPFDDDLVTVPGPRLVDGLEQLAKLLHPELFK